MLKEKTKKVYQSDIRSITKKVPRYWLIDGFFEENNIEEIDVVYLYDRNVRTYLAESTPSYRLEPIRLIPTPNESEQQKAVDEIYPPFDGDYYHTSAIPEDKSTKINVDICNFSWSEDREHFKKFQKCIEFCKVNEYLC